MNPRLFIAFEIAPSESLVRELENIKSFFSHERFSWAKTGQLHMTLKFLGETSPQKMVLVKNAMADAFAGESKSVFTLESLGVFGSSYAPKVLWTHVKPEETCCVWFQNLKSSLLSQGFAYDRQNFVPHLTLARIRSIDDKKRLRDIVSQYESFTFSEFCVSEIILFESVLLPAGAEYIRHFSVSLD